MFCPNCGSETGNGENFCRNCGAGLKLQKAEAAAATQPREAEAVGTAAEAETMVETTETTEAAAAAATASVELQETPQRVVLKRREFFKTIAEPQTKKKILALNILIGIMLGGCGITLLGIGTLIGDIQKIMRLQHAPAQAMSVIPLSVSLVFLFFGGLIMLFYILELQFKHFGFVIPLLYFGILPAMSSAYLVSRFLGFDPTAVMLTKNDSAAQAMASTELLFILLGLGIHIALLVLSVSITKDYNRYRRQFYF